MKDSYGIHFLKLGLVIHCSKRDFSALSQNSIKVFLRLDLFHMIVSKDPYQLQHIKVLEQGYQSALIRCIRGQRVDNNSYL